VSATWRFEEHELNAHPPSSIADQARRCFCLIIVFLFLLFWVFDGKVTKKACNEEAILED
jgi:hypothetical protein